MVVWFYGILGIHKVEEGCCGGRGLFITTPMSVLLCYILLYNHVMRQ